MKLLAITGGVGGAKLSLGFAHVLQPEEVTFLVNTGDDFEHLGLHISPDVDTLLYTLADLANPELGWGRRDESWRVLETLEAIGGESWFQLGDQDIALHLRRRALLNEGKTLTEVTRVLADELGNPFEVLPMSDDPVRTFVHTASGALAFQHYFVRDRCEPIVTGFSFEGLDDARLNTDLRLDEYDAVVICPSNPFVSVDPVLAVGSLREKLASLNCPVVAVSPIVGGKALKGPTAKMMKELAIPSTTEQVASHYRDFLDGFVIDQRDASASNTVEQLGIHVAVEQTVMVSLQDRTDLAKSVLSFIQTIT